MVYIRRSLFVVSLSPNNQNLLPVAIYKIPGFGNIFTRLVAVPIALGIGYKLRTVKLPCKEYSKSKKKRKLLARPTISYRLRKALYVERG